MIKNGLTIKAFYKGKEVKIIQLQHLHFFFKGLSTLSSEWKVEPFKKLWEDCEDDLKYHAMTIFKIGRAHVWTPVTVNNLVCRLLLEKKKKRKKKKKITSY